MELQNTDIIKPRMTADDMRGLTDMRKKIAIHKRRYENMKTDQQQAIVEKLLLLVSRELLTAGKNPRLEAASTVSSASHKSPTSVLQV